MTRPRCAILLGMLLASAYSVSAGDDDGGWSYDGNLRFESADQRFRVDFINRLQARLTASNPELGESGQSFGQEAATVRECAERQRQRGQGRATELASSRDELLRYQGVDSDPVNWGWLCDRGDRGNFAVKRLCRQRDFRGQPWRDAIDDRFLPVNSLWRVSGFTIRDLRH